MTGSDRHGETDASTMTARLLDGTAIAASIRRSIQASVEAFRAAHGRRPGLGILLVGHDPASEVYVRSKLRAAGEVGLRSDLERLPESASFDEAMAVVERLNRSDVHDGVLVQAPLPKTFGAEGEQRIFDAIAPDKDVDGFHPLNVGRLIQNRAVLAPCTPSGIIEMLDRSGIQIAGQQAVVIGRSGIVGRPMAMLLLHRDATVTMCHSKTRGLAAVAATADILVIAIGRAAFVTPDFIKPGATVVDVGINRVTDPRVVERLYGAGSPRHAAFERAGSLLVGDAHPDVSRVAGALTPVPGGVGPLTVAMLLRNTLRAAQARCGERGGEESRG